MTKDNRKTALYIRVSTDFQAEEGYSIDAQKEKLEQFCKLKDIKNYEFYIDGGWSGSNIDRPQMKQMRSDIKEGMIDSVIVYKLDRLSRSQKDTVFLLEDIFIPNNCNFISLNENFDTTTPYGKAMIGILSVFAQLERENIRERTRMGMYERVKAGLWMGGGKVPYGYSYDANKNILVTNADADNVGKIFDLYIQGYSACYIAKLFNLCNDSQVRNILKRKTYLGKIEYNGEVFDGKHTPLVSQEIYDKAQEELSKRTSKDQQKNVYLLTGLIKCGVCGASMRYQKWGKHVKIYCYSQQSSKPKLIRDLNCDNYKNDSDEIEKAVIDDLLRRTKNIVGVKDVKNTSISAISILNNKKKTIEEKIKKLYNLCLTMDDDLLKETISECKAELDEINKQIEREKVIGDTINKINEKHNTINNLKSNWDNMTYMEKRTAVKICIKEIIINKDAIDIVYNF